MDQPAELAAAEAVERRLERALVDAFGSLKDEVSARQVAEDIRNGDISRLLYRLPTGKLTTEMRTAFELLANLSEDQAARVASDVASKHRISTWFDRLAAEFTGGLQRYRDSLITGMSDDLRRTVEAVVIRNAQDGRNPIDTARDIKGMIGLTERQATAVINYRRALETGSGTALDRELRDKRSDGPVGRAIESGTPLERARIDRMVAAYEKRMLQYRARMISRTESLRMANWGTRASYLQMVQRGDFPLDAVNRKWLVAHDERTCPVCLSIPRLNPKGVGLLDPFQSIEGPVELPPIHPACRCSVAYKIDSLMVPERAAPVVVPGRRQAFYEPLELN